MATWLRYYDVYSMRAYCTFFYKIYFVEFVFCVLSYMENVSYILYMIRAQQPVHIIRNILRICHTVY